MAATSSGDEIPLENDDLGGINRGTFLAGKDLHALGGGIRALVELARKVFDGEGGFVFREGEGRGR